MQILDLVRRNRIQKGELIETPTAFFVRYYVNESYANGRRKTKCEKLADRSDFYRSCVDVKPLFDAAMARVNGQREVRATGQSSLADYWENSYFPWVTANKAAATASGYKQVWFKYLEPHIGKIALANLRTVQVTELLDHHAKSGLGRNTLSHIKFVVSGIYRYAIKTGVLPTGKNPVTGAIKGEGAGWTVAVKRPEIQLEYSLETVLAMLRILEPLNLQAAVAVALAYFTALRPAEIRGLKWDDYDGAELNIKRAVWRGIIGETKTEGSAASVPVIEPLKSLLEKLRTQSTGEFILANSANNPMSLDSLNVRIIAPAMKKAGIEWRGYYPGRRGISSRVTDTSKNALNSTGLLRHSTPITALKHYTRAQKDSIAAAMKTIEDQAAEILEKQKQTVQ